MDSVIRDPTRTKGASSYRRAHVEAAWMSMSEHDRVRRCRQHYVLATNLLDPTETKLNPIPSIEAQAISRVLAKFPVQPPPTGD